MTTLRSFLENVNFRSLREKVNLGSFREQVNLRSIREKANLRTLIGKTSGLIPKSRASLRTAVICALGLALLNVLAILNYETYRTYRREQAQFEQQLNQATTKNTPTTTTQKIWPTEIVKGLVVYKADYWMETIENALKLHQERCDKDWANKTVPQHRFNKNITKLCNCVPDSLLWNINVTFQDAPFNETARFNPDVRLGGSWEPDHCIPRYRVSIIIPFRNRTYHLQILLKYLHPILQAQQIAYNVLVVEQRTPQLFNKAELMNVGYVHAMKEYKPDCVIFHDVDRIPEDGRHMYYCPDEPYHLGAYHDEHGYRIAYFYIFGAVTAFRPSAFVRVNGFSNRFWGWGAEDDDMAMRVNETFLHGLKEILRPVRPVAGYKTIRHERDSQNIGNRTLNRYIMKIDRHRTTDGLNSLAYSIKDVVKYPVYTWLNVDLTCTDSCKKAHICRGCP